MSKQLILIALGSFLLLVSTTVWRINSYHAVQNIQLSPTDCSLGQVLAGEQVEQVVTVRNPTPYTVQITRIDTGCDCSSASPHAFVLPPHAEQQVKLNVDMNILNTQLSSSNNLRMPFEKRIVIHHDLAPYQRQDLRMSGTINLALLPNTTLIDYQDQLIAHHQPASKSLDVHFDSIVKDVRFRVSDPKWTVAMAKISEQIYRVTVRPASALSTGPFQLLLTSDGSTTDGRKFIGRDVVVRGQVAPGWRVADPFIQHGAAKLGETVSTQINLEHCDRDWILIDIDGGSDCLAYHYGDSADQFVSISFVHEAVRSGDTSLGIRFQCYNTRTHETADVQATICYFGAI